MPNIIPSDLNRMELYKTIESKAALPVAFRGRQGFSISVPQTTEFTWPLGSMSYNKKTTICYSNSTQTTNPSLFDHCDLQTMNVELNGEKFPYSDYTISFPYQKFSRCYEDVVLFAPNFYGFNEFVAQIGINPSNYKSLFPMMVFDVSKQSERIKTEAVNVNIHAKFNAAVPANTQAYAVVITDRVLKFQSDGKRMEVVY